MIKVEIATAKLQIGINSYHASYPCVLGKNGFTPYDLGREGDAKTPLGAYPIRYGLFRPERFTDQLETFIRADLPFYPIARSDGWCDDPMDMAYNRPVQLPYRASTENLYRSDGVYDVVLVLGHNDDPVIGGEQALGSAIFMHIARPDGRPTMGCVALGRADMLDIIPYLQTGMMVEIG